MCAKTVETKIIFSAIDRVSSKMKSISNSFAPLEKKMRSVGQNFKSLGTRMALGGGFGLTAAFTGAIKPAMDFQESMEGVFKTLNLEKMGITESKFTKTIQEIAIATGKSLGDMAQASAKISEAGVNDDLKEHIKLLEYVAKAQVAWGTDVEFTSTRIAQMRTQLGFSTDEAILFADQINHLTNNMSTTPAKMAEFAAMALSIGKNVGFTNKEILAFGAATTAQGVMPEVARTALKNLGKNFGSLQKPTRSMSIALKELQVDAKALQETFEVNKLAGIQMLADKFIVAQEKLGKTVAGSLLGDITGEEGAPAIQAILKDTGSLEKALKMLNGELFTSTMEFDRRRQKTFFKYKQMMAQLEGLQVKFGEMAFPSLEKLFNLVNRLVNKFENLSPEAQNAMRTLVELGVSLTAIGTALGIASFGFGQIIGVITPFVGLISGMSTAMAAMIVPTKQLGRALNFTFMPMLGMTRPRMHALIRQTNRSWYAFSQTMIGAFKNLGGIMLRMARFTAIGAVFGLVAFGIYKNWDKITNAFGAFYNGFMSNSKMANAFDHLINSFGSLSETLMSLLGRFLSIFGITSNMDNWSNSGNRLADTVAKMVDGFANLIDILDRVMAHPIGAGMLTGGLAGYIAGGTKGALIGAAIGGAGGAGYKLAEYFDGGDRGYVPLADIERHKQLPETKQFLSTLPQTQKPSLETTVTINNNSTTTVQRLMSNGKEVSTKKTMMPHNQNANTGKQTLLMGD